MLALALLAVALADPLLWGPYRSNMYFGMRPRIPHSLMTGLMWFRNDGFGGIQNLRHDYLQNDDATASWTAFDSRVGGTQVIVDPTHNVNLTIDLQKVDEQWVVRVTGTQPEDQVNSLVWYSALEGDGELKLSSKLGSKGVKEPLLKGSSEALGSFSLGFSSDGSYPSSSHPAAKGVDPALWSYACLSIPADNVWKAKDVYLTLLQDNVNRVTANLDPESDLREFPPWSVLKLGNDDTLGGNTHFLQKSFKGNFEFTVSYNDLQADWDARDKALEDAFAYLSDDKKEFAREMLSNLAAGVGYFYGDSLAQEDGGAVQTLEPRGLYTATPSRAFFPRGFYWDEGFHLLGLNDQDQVLDILTSWFNLMDESGWIGREQILGPEARTRVPEQFQVQDTEIANPPTMLTYLAYLGAVGSDSARAKLQDLFPHLETHFKWFRKSQKGKMLEFDREATSYSEAYRWRGRTATHCLASGLDDYPRTTLMGEGELHVDLLSWVGSMAAALESIASTLGYDDKVAHYAEIGQNIRANLVDLHWNADSATFCDVAVDDYEDDIHECHVGYVSHLPFFLRLVEPEDTQKLIALLEALHDPNQLWSDAGIRSLSRSDPAFGTGENYWRGAIWFNMNYLALDALRFYHERSSPEVAEKCAEIYRDLRANLIENVHSEWQRTGLAWEQYDGTTGAAKGAKQFTGWTALVANILQWPAELSEAPLVVEDDVPVPAGPEPAEEEEEVQEEEGSLWSDLLDIVDGHEEL